MKPFKFLTNKPLFNPNTYEEMVMGMIHYCQNNDMNCIGYSHTFTHNDVVETVRRIVIRNVDFVFGEQTYTSVRVDYDVHLIHNHLSDTITRHHFIIDEGYYNRMIEMIRQ
jgi:hypothetical protein